MKGIYLLNTLCFIWATHCFGLPSKVESAVISVEGSKYTNYSYDPGGPTKYGWTLKSYRLLINKNATKETIKNLSKSDAMHYYYVNFWKFNNDDRINNKKLATTLLLSQINLGATRPNKVIQNMVNEFCPTYAIYKNKKIYNDLRKDGVLGSSSIYRINHCKYLWPGYPYILYYYYSKSKNISSVWKWAKKGLTRRIFYELHEKKINRS